MGECLGEHPSLVMITVWVRCSTSRWGVVNMEGNHLFRGEIPSDLL